MRREPVHALSGPRLPQNARYSPMKRHHIAWIAGLACGSGCMVGPDYQRPEIDVPPEFRDAPTLSGDGGVGDLSWWEVYKDPVLQGLIAEALARNYTLEQAIAAVQQAEQFVTIAGAPLWPSVGANFDGSYVDGSRQTSPPQGKGGLWNLGLSASWLIDIWGETRRSQEAALATYYATEDFRNGIAAGLISAVAQAYLQLREFDLELEITQQNLLDRKQTLDLFQKRLEGGIASELEVAAAQADYSNIESAVPALERSISIQENALCVLLARNPGPIERGKALVELQPPPEVPAGLPSSLLERRPDVSQAEQNLVAANAQIGVAKAQFFPQLDLTGTFGFASADLGELFKSGASVWSVGGGLFQPIFQGGAIEANYAASEASWRAARANYLQVVLQAFAEVANALISIQKLQLQRASLETAVTSFQERVRLSNLRYDNGLSSYLEVLNAQQDLYPAQLNLARTQLEQALAVVDLYQALGGGWQELQPPESAP